MDCATNSADLMRNAVVGVQACGQATAHHLAVHHRHHGAADVAQGHKGAVDLVRDLARCDDGQHLGAADEVVRVDADAEVVPGALGSGLASPVPCMAINPKKHIHLRMKKTSPRDLLNCCQNNKPWPEHHGAHQWVAIRVEVLRHRHGMPTKS